MRGLRDLTVAIFSYNRGFLLAETLASVKRNLPHAHIKIYDDMSDEPETCEFLKSCGEVVVSSNVSIKAQHGNLYGNMQQAYEACHTEYLLFLQDDTQVVRELDDARFCDMCDQLFVKSGFTVVHPTFMKKSIEHVLLKEFVLHNLGRYYVQLRDPKEQKVPFCWADVCLMNVALARGKGFSIQGGEGENEALGRQLWGRMPYLADPFVFYAPEVPTFRNRKRPLSGRLASQRLRGIEFGYHDMTLQDAADFIERDLDVWPFAEDFLTPRDHTVKTPFIFQDFSSVSYLKPLAKLEYKLLSARRRSLKLVNKCRSLF